MTHHETHSQIKLDRRSLPRCLHLFADVAVMTEKEQRAREGIARIGAIPFRDRTREDHALMELYLLQRDFAVMDRERADYERGIELSCQRSKIGYWTR